MHDRYHISAEQGAPLELIFSSPVFYRQVAPTESVISGQSTPMAVIPGE